MGYPGVRAWLPYLLMMPLAVAMLVRMGRYRIRVAEGELQVGPAHIALRHLGQIQVIPRAGKQRALGPNLDPMAFVLHRAWIGPLLRVDITDPQDPTPYWIFSVHRATDLAAVLSASTAPGDTGQGEVPRDEPEGRPPGR